MTGPATPAPIIIPLASSAAWTLQGSGARDFLQGYVTSDLEHLRPGHWQVTAFCTLKGRVLATAYVRGSASEATLVMPEAMIAPVLGSLKKYLAFARGCELSQSSARAVRVLAALGELPSGVLFAPVELPGKLPLSLALASESEAQAFGERAHFGEEALWRWHEIEAGFAQVTKPVSEAFLPQMLGLDELGAVSYKKGCYLGQEVVARAAHRGRVKRRLARLSLTRRAHASIGQKLKDARGRERGTLVACAPNPDNREEIGALAVVSGELEALAVPAQRTT